jgi:uncharacterized protein YbjT (DUF2867 family)
MQITVIGASRGSGRAVTARLAADGHTVTAFARSIEPVVVPAGVRAVAGDVADPAAVAAAVAGADAVVVTLGISDHPLAVRLHRSRTALDVRSAGTATVIDAMRQHGVRRLLVQTTYGAGDSYPRLSFAWKATFRLLLHPQLLDSERQERLVRTSGLDWTLVRPVALSDGPGDGPALVSTEGEVASMAITRGQVADAIAAALVDPARIGATLALSA